jgi:hypothetical protein
MLVFRSGPTHALPVVRDEGTRVVVDIPAVLQRELLEPWVDDILERFPDRPVMVRVFEHDGKAGLHLGFAVLTALLLRNESHRYTSATTKADAADA